MILAILNLYVSISHLTQRSKELATIETVI